MQNEVSYIIEKLKLIAHPEGGYFNEIYRSSELISKSSLPQRYNADRNFSTSIYFMLAGEQISLFHRLKSDEIWHYYKGSVTNLHCFEGNQYSLIRIGSGIENNEQPQFVIKAGVWFAAEIENKNSYSLIGCTVAPGFDFADFEFAQRNDLIQNFPDHSDLIKRFTKD